MPLALVASIDPVLLDEIVRAVEEIPRWRVTSARSTVELTAAMASGPPDVVLVSQESATAVAASEPASLAGCRVVIVDRELQPDALRAALVLGARGSLIWPAEHSELRRVMESGLAPRRSRGAAGKAVAMWGPKGGSGASVLAAHLAGALGSLGPGTILVDYDLEHGDQTAFLSVPEDAKNVLDLLRVLDELSPAVLDGVVWRHAAGFEAVASPGSPGESQLVKPGDLTELIAAIRALKDRSIFDLRSGFSEIVYQVASEVDRFFVVLTPEVTSLRRGREALRSLTAAGVGMDRIGVILNRAGMNGVTAPEVQAVVGSELELVVPEDWGMSRSGDRGRLATSGFRLIGPLARDLAGLPPLRGRFGLHRFLTR